MESRRDEWSDIELMIKTRKARLLLSLVLISVFVPLSFVSENTISALQTQDYELDPVNIEIHLNLNETAILVLSATCNNIGAEDLSEIIIRIESTNVILRESTINESPVDSEVITLERYSTVVLQLDESLPSGESAKLYIEVEVNDIQTDVGSSILEDIYYVDSIYYVRPLSTYRNFTLVTILPAGATLSQESVSPIFPTALTNFTDGQSIAFVWFTSELQPGQEKVFIVRYQSKQSPTIVNGINMLEIILIASIFLGMGLVAGHVFPMILARIRQLGRVKFVGVTSEEDEVLEVIRLKGGSCSQKDLYGELKMSQSKVSLVLTALEERGLVRRFKDGRENIVHIIEE